VVVICLSCVDRYEMIDARAVWQETHDANKTLEALRGHHCNERQLLEGLKRSAENDFVGALSFVSTASFKCSIHFGLVFFIFY